MNEECNKQLHFLYTLLQVFLIYFCKLELLLVKYIIYMFTQIYVRSFVHNAWPFGEMYDIFEVFYYTDHILIRI